MRLMSKGEYVIVPKGTKFTGSGKLGLIIFLDFLGKNIKNCPPSKLFLFNSLFTFKNVYMY